MSLFIKSSFCYVSSFQEGFSLVYLKRTWCEMTVFHRKGCFLLNSALDVKYVSIFMQKMKGIMHLRSSLEAL